jgi:hypothetical protein
VFTYATEGCYCASWRSPIRGRVGGCSSQSGKVLPINSLRQANFKKTYLEQNTNFYNMAGPKAYISCAPRLEPAHGTTLSRPRSAAEKRAQYLNSTAQEFNLAQIPSYVITTHKWRNEVVSVPGYFGVHTNVIFRAPMLQKYAPVWEGKMTASRHLVSYSE